jgi:hypothetical protein
MHRTEDRFSELNHTLKIHTAGSYTVNFTENTTMTYTESP